jgi:hypothetical protein
MKFIEMCNELFKDVTKVAYNIDYPKLTANVRVRRINDEMADAGNYTDILYYYNGDAPTSPVAIIRGIYDSDGWEVVDSYSDRANIQNFMKMPDAKNFLEELYDMVNDTNWDGKFPKDFASKYRYRLEEAFALRIIYGDLRLNKLVFTDIGEDLIKTL